MLSSVLNSQRAIDVNIEIMRAFVRLREMLASFGQRVTRWCLTIIHLLARGADGCYRFCNVRLD